jgi:hypothetical protein
MLKMSRSVDKGRQTDDGRKKSGLAAMKLRQVDRGNPQARHFAAQTWCQFSSSTARMSEFLCTCPSSVDVDVGASAVDQGVATLSVVVLSDYARQQQQA